MDYRRVKKDQGIDLSKDKMVCSGSGSRRESKTIVFDYETEIICLHHGGSVWSKHLVMKLRRARLTARRSDSEAFDPPLDAGAQRCCDRCEENCEVVLVGGSTRIPKVRRSSRTSSAKNRQECEPDEVVAIGAAVSGRRALGERLTFCCWIDPLSLGIETPVVYSRS